MEVRRCPHSGVGRDFLLRRRVTLMKTAVTRKRKVEKWIQRCQIDRLCKGYKRAIDEIWGPIAKNGSPFWLTWANLGCFGGPLGQIWGHPASPNWFKIFDLDLPQPVPPLFHSVPTVWDHRSLQIAILANLGSFWAVFGPFLGPGGPKFDKFCVREVERGPGHLES